jgi:hypothetical protein
MNERETFIVTQPYLIQNKLYRIGEREAEELCQMSARRGASRGIKTFCDDSDMKGIARRRARDVLRLTGIPVLHQRWEEPKGPWEGTLPLYGPEP